MKWLTRMIMLGAEEVLTDLWVVEMVKSKLMFTETVS
jgi:hypothetical protein